MSAAALSYRHGVLPWADAADDDRRLRRIQQVGVVLALAGVAAISAG